MARNSQIINALAMIPEAVKIWGRDTASSLESQIVAQDRNIISAAISKARGCYPGGDAWLGCLSVDRR